MTVWVVQCPLAVVAGFSARREDKIVRNFVTPTETVVGVDPCPGTCGHGRTNGKSGPIRSLDQFREPLRAHDQSTEPIRDQDQSREPMRGQDQSSELMSQGPKPGTNQMFYSGVTVRTVTGH